MKMEQFDQPQSLFRVNNQAAIIYASTLPTRPLIQRQGHAVRCHLPAACSIMAEPAIFLMQLSWR